MRFRVTLPPTSVDKGIFGTCSQSHLIQGGEGKMQRIARLSGRAVHRLARDQELLCANQLASAGPTGRLFSAVPEPIPTGWEVKQL